MRLRQKWQEPKVKCKASDEAAWSFLHRLHPGERCAGVSLQTGIAIVNMQQAQARAVLVMLWMRKFSREKCTISGLELASFIGLLRLFADTDNDYRSDAGWLPAVAFSMDSRIWCIL